MDSASYLSLSGGILFLAGWLWTILSGFQKSGKLWGILNIIPLQPLVGIVSLMLKKVSFSPILLMLAAFVLLIVGNIYNKF